MCFLITSTFLKGAFFINSDWYLDAVVQKGVLCHPVVGGATRSCEVLNIFLGSDHDLNRLTAEARQIGALSKGKKT